MLKIGVTGGIGAGKSVICSIFETLGYSVYYADERAKHLIGHSKFLKSDICDLLGEEAYTEEGAYNRMFVASKVFNNASLLQQLNEIIHPAVKKDAEEFFERQTKPLAFYEAALIIEIGNQKNFDQLICVTAPVELRIKRVMARNGIERSQVEKRINSQLSENEKRKHCHFEIINDGQHFLLPQVLNAHKFLLERSN